MIRWLVVGLIASAGLLVLAEGFVRLAGGPPAEFLYTGKFRDQQTDWDVTYGVDSENRRVTCTSHAARSRKIAVIGDSFVFGQGVPDCEDFVSLLNQSGDVTFVNLGVIGVGLTEYRLIARDFVDETYTGVLVVLYGNDIPGSNHSLAGRLADRFSLFSLLRKVWRAHKVRSTLEGSSDLPGVFNNIEAILASDPNYFVRVSDPSPAARERLRTALDQLLAVLTRHRSSDSVQVVVVPSAASISESVRKFIQGNGGNLPPFGQRGSFQETVEAMTAKYGVRFIDVYDEFREKRGLYHVHDLHLNSSGHAVLAALIGETLQPE